LIPGKPPPRDARLRVSPAREAALHVLGEVRKARFAEDALLDSLTADDLALDRALATELVYGVLRWKRRLDGIIGRCSDHPKKKIQPRLRDILRIALYQIFLLDRIPEHAAVDQAVRQVRSHSDKRAAGFANALLRRALREKDSMDPLPSDDPYSLASYYSHPQWLVERGLKEFGLATTRQILVHNNSRATVVIRANTLKTARSDLEKLLRDSGLEIEPVVGMPDALMVPAPRAPVNSIAGFHEGLFAVQETASQMIAPLLAAQPDHRVLDACAATGGKTAHIAALTGNRAEITAVDLDELRLEETRQNLKRLGVERVTFVQRDATDPELIHDLGLFDRILVDAPCSNLGVLRHSPEAKYRTTPRDLNVFAERQIRLLDAVARALKPGGILVYSVCTISEEETSGVARAFLNHRPDFQFMPIEQEQVPIPEFIGPNRVLRTFPPIAQFKTDGFFAARFTTIG